MEIFKFDIVNVSALKFPKTRLVVFVCGKEKYTQLYRDIRWPEFQN